MDTHLPDICAPERRKFDTSKIDSSAAWKKARELNPELADRLATLILSGAFKDMGTRIQEADYGTGVLVATDINQVTGQSGTKCNIRIWPQGSFCVGSTSRVFANDEVEDGIRHLQRLICSSTPVVSRPEWRSDLGKPPKALIVH